MSACNAPVRHVCRLGGDKQYAVQRRTVAERKLIHGFETKGRIASVEPSGLGTNIGSRVLRHLLRSEVSHPRPY